MTISPSKCDWIREPEQDQYESSCGHSFYFVDGLLAEQNGFTFCPYCGLTIKPVEPKECPECGAEMGVDPEKCWNCTD